jgi:hypothetical protein
MKYLTLMYLIIVFHLPSWKHCHLEGKYRYLDKMPYWMKKAIRVRNEYERKYGLLDCFYWFKLGRFYIRNDHSYPAACWFKYSDRHLFCWKYK